MACNTGSVAPVEEGQCIEMSVNPVLKTDMSNKPENGKAIMLKPGSRTDAAGKAISNVILLSLPDSEFAPMRPHLESMDLP